MWIIYRVLISSYFSLIRVAAWFRADAKNWVDGRKNFDGWLAAQNPENHSHIWIHCSSLGEFEQGRSLIDTLRFKYPDKLIWLSFFHRLVTMLEKNTPGRCSQLFSIRQLK